MQWLLTDCIVASEYRCHLLHFTHTGTHMHNITLYCSVPCMYACVRMCGCADLVVLARCTSEGGTVVLNTQLPDISQLGQNDQGNSLLKTIYL